MKKTLFLKLLTTKKLKVGEGKIKFGDSDLNLVPAIFISTLMEKYRKEDNLAELYFISWLWGYETVNTVKKELGLEKPEEIYDIGMKFAESMGIGLYQTHDYFPGKYTKFKIERNPFLSNLNVEEIEENIDYLIAGAMAGGGSHVHEEPCHTVETRCQVQGSEKCEFITGTEEELKDRGLWEETKKLYNLEENGGIVDEIFNEYGKKEKEYFVELVLSNKKV